MADLKTTAEERAFAVQCRSCFGRGMRDPTCFRCDDSTEDHECPPEVTCGACKGSGDNPEVRRILDDLDTLLAENEGLSGVVRGPFMCTRCPVPCQRCRAGGIGAFCGSTPCACACHVEPVTTYRARPA